MANLKLFTFLIIFASIIYVNSQYTIVKAKDMNSFCDKNLFKLIIDIEVDGSLNDYVSFHLKAYSVKELLFKCMIDPSKSQIICITNLNHYKLTLKPEETITLPYPFPEVNGIVWHYNSFLFLIFRRSIRLSEECGADYVIRTNITKLNTTKWDLITKVNKIYGGKCLLSDTKDNYYSFDMNLNVIGGNLFNRLDNETDMEISFLQNITMPFVIGPLQSLITSNIKFKSHDYYNMAFCYPNQKINSTNYLNEEGINFHCNIPISDQYIFNGPLRITSFSDNIYSKINDVEEESTEIISIYFTTEKNPILNGNNKDIIKDNEEENLEDDEDLIFDDENDKEEKEENDNDNDNENKENDENDENKENNNENKENDENDENKENNNENKENDENDENKENNNDNKENDDDNKENNIEKEENEEKDINQSLNSRLNINQKVQNDNNPSSAYSSLSGKPSVSIQSSSNPPSSPSISNSYKSSVKSSISSFPIPSHYQSSSNNPSSLISKQSSISQNPSSIKSASSSKKLSSSSGKTSSSYSSVKPSSSQSNLRRLQEEKKTKKQYLLLDDRKNNFICPDKPIFEIVNIEKGIVYEPIKNKEDKYNIILNGFLKNGYKVSDKKIIPLEFTLNEIKFNLSITNNLVEELTEKKKFIPCSLTSGTLFLEKQTTQIKCIGDKLEQKNLENTDITINWASKENKYLNDIVIKWPKDLTIHSKKLYSYNINAFSIKKIDHDCFDDKYFFYINILNLDSEPQISFDFKMLLPSDMDAHCKFYTSNALKCYLDLRLKRIKKGSQIKLPMAGNYNISTPEGNYINFTILNFTYENETDIADEGIFTYESCGNNIFVGAIQDIGYGYGSAIAIIISIIIIFLVTFLLIAYCVVFEITHRNKKGKYFAHTEEKKENMSASTNPITGGNPSVIPK